MTSDIVHLIVKRRKVMLTAKRIIIATICGIIFGLFCMYLASSNPNPSTPLTCTGKWMIILSRTMMGFTIGVSAIRLAWWLHGIVLGFICSILMGVAVWPDYKIVFSTLLMGIIYGFLTELITTKIFKAKGAGQ